ncbi:hypothetical protein DSM106972_007240 [Dulcicalothrix desertica PCC 7102]|uniref:Uncharacterized protein n=1 Tax=Dulcicalothrix desertica PCC 7102 TaxID=232991 RepID=A0A433VVW3_9CYAN|nr:hypothetical protein [Dulcicalothrix desertica]RUT10229.1 hypothetical protein DSM106972_007240 [Dulcicalothrix desertica PCC 7102]TWH40795.1 hypothetical protein CAL7102_10151 [Dulcicalothrix desertica PCC 7102]
MNRNRIVGIIYGIGTIAASIYFIISATVTTLTCTRIESTCELVQSRLLRSDFVQKIPLNQLLGAKVDVSKRMGRNRYQIKLIAKSGEIDFTNFYSSYDESKKQKNAYLINTFVQDSKIPTLEVQQDERPLTYVICGIGIIFGLGTVISSLNHKE